MTEITDFNNLRLLVSKSKDHLLIYYYLPNQKNEEYLIKINRAIRRSKRRIKVYTCMVTKYPGINQKKPSVALYYNGRRFTQIYAEVDQSILDLIVKRFVE